MQTEKPHLVSLGSGRLSTAITLLPLEEGECWLPSGPHGHTAGGREAELFSLPAGRTTIGTATTDIILQGAGLAPQHCYIENAAGTLTLHPCGNACAIDGVLLQWPTRLTQGRDTVLLCSGAGPSSRWCALRYWGVCGSILHSHIPDGMFLSLCPGVGMCRMLVPLGS